MSNQSSGALARFTVLDSNRSTLKTYWEQYAAYTLPYICPDDNFDGDNYRLSEVYDSVAAKGVNHLANRLMLAMFGSSVPFCRLTMPKKLKAKVLGTTGLTEDQLDELLSTGEQEMLTVLAASGIRTRLFEVLKHLIIVGNVAVNREKDYTVIPVKDYVVRRSVSGRAVEILFRNKVSWDELTDEVQKLVPKDLKEAKEISQITWCKFADDKYTCEQWVNDTKLPDDFTQKYSEADFPYSILTWVLPTKCNYGVGLIEEHRGDIFTTDILSEAQSDMAGLAAQYRWRVNPSGSTDINEFKKSVNGDAVAGEDGDIKLEHVNNLRQIEAVLAVSERYERRLAEVFMQSAALVRDAERVTAVEIRMLAQELDTALGGVYTRLAVDLQKPLAMWLMPKTESFRQGSGIEPVVITGLDALSRSADTDRLLRFITNLNQLATLPPETQDWLQLGPILTQLAAGEGLASRKYIADQETANASRDARNQSMAAAKQQQNLPME